MATKKKQATSLKNTLTSVQTKAQELNKEVLLASEELNRQCSIQKIIRH